MAPLPGTGPRPPIVSIPVDTAWRALGHAAVGLAGEQTELANEDDRFRTHVKKGPTPAQQLEFERLRAFVIAGFEDMCRSSEMPPEQHPAAAVDRMWSEVSPSTALKGLRAAADDVVEMLQDLKGGDLAAFEKRLEDAGAPSLAAMRARRVRDIFRILNRATIRDDEEWRLVNAAVSDMDDRILDETNRADAQRLLGEYELSKPTGSSVRTELD